MFPEKNLPRKGADAASSPLRTHPSSLWTETSQDGFPASPSVLTTSLCLERTIWDRADPGPVAMMERGGPRGRLPCGLRPSTCVHAAMQGDAQGPGPARHRDTSRLDQLSWELRCAALPLGCRCRHKLIFQMETPQLLLHLCRAHAGRFSDVSHRAPAPFLSA